ncbi:MAG: 30S ribosomal protein S15 [Candidatus Babeliales bacterium]|nr:30S ribosomal protein S15 [Candidatus Babeliales bacterium]
MNEKFAKIAEKVQHHDKDTGSLEVQIVAMTDKILSLSAHFKAFPKDYSSRRGLLRLVNRRRNFLDYLKKHNETLYKDLLVSLDLRK